MGQGLVQVGGSIGRAHKHHRLFEDVCLCFTLIQGDSCQPSFFSLVNVDMWRKSSEPSPLSQPVDVNPDIDTHTVYEDGGRRRGEDYTPIPAMDSQPSHEKLIPAFAPTTMPFRRRSILRDWWLEIGARVVAIGSCVAVFGTLYPYAGRTLPD